MTWEFNRDYKDLGQVEQFYPAYLSRRAAIESAGMYTYNDLFSGHIPGIEGPDEGRAIYMLQTLHSVKDMQAKIAEHRAAGWRDFDPAEVDAGPVRYAGVAMYGWYMGGDGFQKWTDNARLTRYGRSSVMLLTGRARTNGHLVDGHLLVKD